MRRARRPKGDWVYRGPAQRSDGISDDLATYNNSLTLAAGTADGVILYDSKQHLYQATRQGMASGGAPGYSMTTAARAEGTRPLMLRVTGQIVITPSTWALGNFVTMGYRIMAPEQDTGTGAVLLDNDYFMWSPSGGTVPADHANSRRLNLWERRFWRAFNSSESARWVINVNAKLRVRLNPNDCLALYFENHPSAVSTTSWFWLRTFVVDEGTG